MCSYCGSLWNTVDHQVRLSPGRKMSKSVRRIVQRMNEDDDKVPRVRASLAKKAIRNEKNKLVIRCSLCSKNTELPFEKKTRLKPPNVNNPAMSTVQDNGKKKRKKKKKSRDKSAGLNISVCTPEPQLNKKDNAKTPVKIPVIIPKVHKSLSAAMKKPKKLNVQRLKQIVQHSTATPTKRSSLHGFLAELR